MEEINKLLNDLVKEKDEMRSFYKTEDLLLRMFRDRKLCFKQKNVELLNKVLECLEKIICFFPYIKNESEFLLKIRSVIQFILDELEGEKWRDLYLLLLLNLHKLDSRLKMNLRMANSRDDLISRPEDVPNTHWWWWFQENIKNNVK